MYSQFSDPRLSLRTSRLVLSKKEQESRTQRLEQKRCPDSQVFHRSREQRPVLEISTEIS